MERGRCVICHVITFMFLSDWFVNSLTTQHQQSCELSWRYARSCYDIALLKGKSGDAEGKKSLLYEGTLNTLLIQNWMWINFYSPKESMYRYSLIFLVTAAVHALNNNKVHITEKTCGTWLTSTHKCRSKIWWLPLLPSVSSTLPSGENRRENDTEGYLIWRGY